MVKYLPTNVPNDLHGYLANRLFECQLIPKPISSLPPSKLFEFCSISLLDYLSLVNTATGCVFIRVESCISWNVFDYIGKHHTFRFGTQQLETPAENSLQIYNFSILFVLIVIMN